MGAGEALAQRGALSRLRRRGTLSNSRRRQVTVMTPTVHVVGGRRRGGFREDEPRSARLREPRPSKASSLSVICWSRSTSSGADRGGVGKAPDEGTSHPPDQRFRRSSTRGSWSLVGSGSLPAKRGVATDYDEGEDGGALLGCSSSSRLICPSQSRHFATPVMRTGRREVMPSLEAQSGPKPRLRDASVRSRCLQAAHRDTCSLSAGSSKSRARGSSITRQANPRPVSWEGSRARKVTASSPSRTSPVMINQITDELQSSDRAGEDRRRPVFSTASGAGEEDRPIRGSNQVTPRW